jgi:hypothetical protein
LLLVVRGPAPGSRESGSEPSACFAGSRSPWSPALAPAPQPVAQPCSSASWLLCRSQTSLDRASWLQLLAFPPRTIGPKGLWPIQRFPSSRTRSVRTCQDLRPRRARRALDFSFCQVTTSALGFIAVSRLNSWPISCPTDASPTSSRTPAHGSGATWIATPSSQWTFTTYYLPVPPGALTRVTACTLALSPMRDALIEGFSHFVTSMTAPMLLAGAFAGWGLHPPESAAFARRTPKSDIR